MLTAQSGGFNGRLKGGDFLLEQVHLVQTLILQLLGLDVFSHRILIPANGGHMIASIKGLVGAADGNAVVVLPHAQIQAVAKLRSVKVVPGIVAVTADVHYNGTRLQLTNVPLQGSTQIEGGQKSGGGC